jgi:hypothetical protein
MALDRNQLIAAAFALYPSWWRERYLDEAQQVTEDLVATGRSPWGLASNLAVGAVRARVQAAGMPFSYEAWARRTCAVVALATAPALVVIPVMLTIRQKSLAPLPRVIPSTTTATSLYLTLLFGLLVLISSLVWGYFALSSGISEVGTHNRRWLRRLVRAPKYLALLGVILFITSSILAPHRWETHDGHLAPLGGHPSLAHALLEISATAWLLCGAASALLVVAVARRATLSLGTLAVGLVLARVMVALLWVMTASTALLDLRYGTGVAEIGGEYITVFGSGDALVILASVLGAMATVTTFGTVLAGRSFRVARALALRVDVSD